MRGLPHTSSCETRRAVLLLELVLAMLFISVALVGIIDAFRFCTIAHSESIKRAQACLLLEQKANAMELESAFPAGLQEGAFPENLGFRWKTEVIESKMPDLFRAKIQIIWSDQSITSVVYLRKKEPD